jgi:hypothetical protein
MPEVTIFVEGIADAKFISDILKKYHKTELVIKKDILFFEGKDKWEKTAGLFRKSTAEGKTNLLIFDADEDPTSRQKEIYKKREELGLSFELFLLPGRNDPGDLETLLESIVPTDKVPVLNCFSSYEACLSKLDFAVHPNDRKTKIYVYTKSLTWVKKGRADEDPAKEVNRNYLDREIWNLESSYLQPLLEFLTPYFETK